MAWRRPGPKPLSEPMMFSLTTHICVFRRHWIISQWREYIPSRTVIDTQRFIKKLIALCIRDISVGGILRGVSCVHTVCLKINIFKLKELHWSDPQGHGIGDWYLTTTKHTNMRITSKTFGICLIRCICNLLNKYACLCMYAEWLPLWKTHTELQLYSTVTCSTVVPGKIEHYLRLEDKTNKSKVLLYCEIFRYMKINIRKRIKSMKNISVTSNLETNCRLKRIWKCGPTYGMQMVNQQIYCW